MEGVWLGPSHSAPRRPCQATWQLVEVAGSSRVSAQLGTDLREPPFSAHTRPHCTLMM